MERHARKYVRGGVILLVLLIILGYGYFRAENLIRGPRITITEPVHGSTVTSSFIEVVGTTKNVTHITLNDRDIFIDEHGAFREKLLLPYGYTILSVKAEDRFGRSTAEKIELVYK